MSIKDTIKEFTAKKEFTAVRAYSLTKYGEPMDEDQIFNKYVKTISELIESKAQRGYYSLVIDIDPGFPEISTNLVDCFSNKGYTCFILDSSIDTRIKTPQLFVSWDR